MVLWQQPTVTLAKDLAESSGLHFILPFLHHQWVELSGVERNGQCWFCVISGNGWLPPWADPGLQHEGAVRESVGEGHARCARATQSKRVWLHALTTVLNASELSELTISHKFHRP